MVRGKGIVLGRRERQGVAAGQRGARVQRTADFQTGPAIVPQRHHDVLGLAARELENARPLADRIERQPEPGRFRRFGPSFRRLGLRRR